MKISNTLWGWRLGAVLFILLGTQVRFIMHNVVFRRHDSDIDLKWNISCFDFFRFGFDSVPFVIAVYFWSKARRSASVNYRAARARMTGAAIGGIMVLIFVICSHALIAWEIRKGGAPSTIAITEIFVTIYATPIFFLGYGITLAIAAFQGAFRPNPFPPACVYCGYSLRGLDSPHCPECGKDVPPKG